ncbi:MAG: phosphoglycolate phosphatase [Gammaproteobacteria bacterium]|nr:MAG: phosphoglycolate phosphatase [Gammaproteobacteria bacterium]
MINGLTTVLFDLDGTLADTAPDLTYAINHVLQAEGRKPVAVDALRPTVSLGGRAMIHFAFGIDSEHEDFLRIRDQFLETYQANVARETRLFPGMPELLAQMESDGLKWGVVTNKSGWLTDPLMDKLNLSHRAACVVSGDTTPNRKPHPDPLLHACDQVGATPGECLYIGDAVRDIQAGHAAGMQTAVALFGYIPEDEDPHDWGADLLFDSPQEIGAWLGGPT